MAVTVEGALPAGVTAKDIILAVIAQIGTGGGQGYVIEYRGVGHPGAVDGGPDDHLQHVHRGRRAGRHDRAGRDDLRLPEGPAARAARARTGTPRSKYWRTLRSDDDAVFDDEVVLDADDPDAVRHLGHQPRPGRCRCRQRCPSRPTSPTTDDRGRRRARAGSTWAWSAGTPLRDIAVDTVFLGSCTNGRIEDLRAAADVLAGPPGRRRACACSWCPGSARVRLQAEAEGLDEVFTEAGAEWRLAGCSMCLGMNPDQLQPGERCASTSNRNFEGRQGKGGRTHLVSPAGRGRHRRRAARCPRRRTSTDRRHADVRDDRRTAMEEFTTHTGVGVPLRRSNVDTDQIIPAVYLKRVTRTGFEDGLFAAWRKDPPSSSTSRRYAGPRPGRRPRLRHRLVPRARRLGADGLRLPRRRQLALRRHLPRQLRQAGTAHRPGRRRTTSS